MNNPNYCTKHNRQKVLMITSSFCPQCDAETFKSSVNILPEVTLNDLNGFKKVISTNSVDYIDALDWSTHIIKGYNYHKDKMVWEAKYGTFAMCHKQQSALGGSHFYIVWYLSGPPDMSPDIPNDRVKFHAVKVQKLNFWHPVLLKLFPL